MTDSAIVVTNTELNDKERIFVEALVSDEHLFNIAAASQVAGMLASNAHALLRKDRVRKAISAHLAQRRALHKDLRDSVIEALWNLATYDIKDLVEDDEGDLDRMPESLDEALELLAGGRLKPPHKLPPQLRACVVGVKRGKYGWEYTFEKRSPILMRLLSHFELPDKLQDVNKDEVPRSQVVFYEPTPEHVIDAISDVSDE